MNSEKLMDMKDRIEKKKSEKSRLEGKKEQLESQLKREFECDSVEDAKLLIDKMDADIEELDEKIQSKEKEIERKYEELQG
jgi:hypothetical protein